MECSEAVNSETSYQRKSQNVKGQKSYQQLRVKEMECDLESTCLAKSMLTTQNRFKSKLNSSQNKYYIKKKGEAKNSRYLNRKDDHQQIFYQK